jgi:hypothetical protein
LNSDYSVLKVLNNYPKQPFIADTTNVTLTVTCSGAEAIFIGYLAEYVQLTFKNSGGSTLNTQTITNSYDMGEAYLLNGLTHWNNGIFAECPSNTETVDIQLVNSVNVQGNLNYWSAAGDSFGKLMTGGGANSILHDNYPQIRLGSFVGPNQITRITGLGDGNRNIKFSSGGTTDFSVGSMQLPIAVNTIRAGKLLTTVNPQVGLTESSEEFGITEENATGLNFRIGESRRVFAGSLSVKESERANVTRIFKGVRAQPIAAEILGYQESTSVFGFLSVQPTLSYSTQGSQLYSMNFEIKEIV